MRSNKRRVLLLDLDDVLNTFNSDWIREYNQKYGEQHYKTYGKWLSIEDIKDWNQRKFILPEVNVLEEIVYQNNFFRHLGVQPYAQEATKELSDFFEIYIVSASCFKTVVDKAEWLIDNFSHIPIEHFIPCYNKYMIRGNVIVDDGFHNLIDFPGKRILFDKPWNTQYQKEAVLKKHNIEVMNSWKDWRMLLNV